MEELKNLMPVVYANQRVLLTVQLAEVYNCAVYRIRDNFRAAKEQFVEGRDYFKVTGEPLRKLKKALNEGKKLDLVNAPLIGKNASHVHLWTKQGAILHCKMINTDEAWQVIKIGALENRKTRRSLPFFTFFN